MMAYLKELENDPETIMKETNQAWRTIVDGKKAILQIAGSVSDMAMHENDLKGPWKSIFAGKQKSLNLRFVTTSNNSLFISNIVY